MLVKLIACVVAVTVFVNSASATWRVDADTRYGDSSNYKYRHVLYRMEMVTDPDTGEPEEKWVYHGTGSNYTFDGWITTAEEPIAKYSHIGTTMAITNAASTDKIEVRIEIDATNDGIVNFVEISGAEGSATWIP